VRRIDLSNFQVATSETARDINRRIVLNLIRTHQPISRADLARHSGLQRSTVSVIAEQLIRDRWIKEGANGHTPRGRRPQLLHLNKERVGIIGINIRPITTTLALADLDANFLAQDSLATPSDPKQFVAELLPRVRKLMRARPELTCEGIGVSLPGLVDPDRGMALYVPCFNWRNLNVSDRIAAATGLSVFIDNDANAAALAELWFGQPEVREWAYRVGLPAKSGVSGGIVAVVPGKLAIGVFSPRLDARGNSARGIKVCQELSRQFGLHLRDNALARLGFSLRRSHRRIANSLDCANSFFRQSLKIQVRLVQIG